MTAPVAIVFLIWAINVGQRYYEFSVRYGDAVGNPNLIQGGRYEVNRLKAKVRTSLFEEGAADEQEFRQVHLMINQGDEGSLNSHLPSSGRKYKDGFLMYPDGSMGKVDLRYRGDFAWHWATHKKSWRVKTPKLAMWNNLRAFNLIIPKGQGIVEDCLGYWLAREMGLLAPESDLVEVVVNGKTRGVHTLTEQLEELVLRKGGRMPGDLFAGELIGRDHHFGVVNLVFRHPGLWEKIAINNHPIDPAGNSSLVRLCELLAEPPSEENALALGEILNMEAFGKFAAFRVLGQSRHYDRIHNWRLFYDPWKCRFEPVVWDTVPWHQNGMPRGNAEPFREVLFNSLDDRLMLNHQYRIATDTAFHEFFVSGLRDRLMAEYDRLVAISEKATRRDPYLLFNLMFQDPGETRVYQKDLRRRMGKVFDTLEEEHASQPPLMSVASLGPDSWRVALFGRRAVQGVRLEFDSVLKENPGLTIGYESDGQKYEYDVSDVCEVSGRFLELNLPLIGGMAYVPNPKSKDYTDRGKMVLSAATYDLTLNSPAPGQQAIRLVAVLADGETVEMTQLEQLPVFPTDGQYAQVIEPLAQQFVEWSGDMLIEGEQILRKSVLIAPGTTIRMAPNASVVIEGVLVAQGTFEEPIRVIPADPEAEPWGTFGIRGPGSDGSVLKHVEFKGGSGWVQPLAEFSSMFSIHWVQNVTIRSCLFEDSFIVDDMVHGVYSKVGFYDCTFRRSLQDALDMDISEVVVRGCVFDRSGNDSIDLMTSRAIVEDTQFLHSGDKGISIGENSTLFARNCLFDTCHIGLESKDDSQAAVVNSDIYRCKLGVNAYQKNWRYNNGGEIYLYKSRLIQNELPLQADKRSILGVSDTYVESLEQFWQPEFRRGPGLHEDGPTRARVRAGKPFRFEREQELLAPLGTQCWQRVDEKVRGSEYLTKP